MYFSIKELPILNFEKDVLYTKFWILYYFYATETMKLEEMIHGTLVFDLEEYELRGLALLPYFKFPWKNRKEKKCYLDNLEEDDTPESFHRAVDLEIDIMLESYHIMSSWALVNFVLGIAGFLFTVSSQLNHFLTITIIVSGSLTILFFFIYMIIRKRIRLKKEELIMYKTLMSNFSTWPDPENIEFDID